MKKKNTPTTWSGMLHLAAVLLSAFAILTFINTAFDLNLRYRRTDLPKDYLVAVILILIAALTYWGSRAVAKKAARQQVSKK